MMHKNRRNDRGLGYKREFKVDCGNMKNEGGRIEESSWLRSQIVAVNEPQNWGELSRNVEEG